MSKIEKVTVGEPKTLYVADGFNFGSEEEAEAFLASPWPRTLPGGRVVTSDRVSFPASKKKMAEARQANLDSRGGGS